MKLKVSQLKRMVKEAVESAIREISDDEAFGLGKFAGSKPKPQVSTSGNMTALIQGVCKMYLTARSDGFEISFETVPPINKPPIKLGIPVTDPDHAKEAFITAVNTANHPSMKGDIERIYSTIESMAEQP